MQELDYHHSSASAVQSVKLLLARPCPSLQPDLCPAPPPPVSSTTDLTAHLTPRLYRFNNSIVYEVRGSTHHTIIPLPASVIQTQKHPCPCADPPSFSLSVIAPACGGCALPPALPPGGRLPLAVLVPSIPHLCFTSASAGSRPPPPCPSTRRTAQGNSTHTLIYHSTTHILIYT